MAVFRYLDTGLLERLLAVTFFRPDLCPTVIFFIDSNELVTRDLTF